MHPFYAKRLVWILSCTRVLGPSKAVLLKHILAAHQAAIPINPPNPARLLQGFAGIFQDLLGATRAEEFIYSAKDFFQVYKYSPKEFLSDL